MYLFGPILPRRRCFEKWFPCWGFNSPWRIWVKPHYPRSQPHCTDWAEPRALRCQGLCCWNLWLWARLRLGWAKTSAQKHRTLALKVKQPCRDTKWGDAEGAICLPCKQKAKRQHCSGAAIPKGHGGCGKQQCQNQWKAECKVNSKAGRCWKQILNVHTTFLFA